MTKKHNGQRLKSLLFENHISVKKISEITGRARQQVHADFNRITIKDEVLDVYLTALKIDRNTFDKIEEEQGQNSSNYLMEHLSGLEAQFKEFREQLQVKDMQIASLQRMLEMTLGKSEDVIIFKTTPVLAMYPGAGALEA